MQKRHDNSKACPVVLVQDNTLIAVVNSVYHAGWWPD